MSTHAIRFGHLTRETTRFGDDAESWRQLAALLPSATLSDERGSIQIQVDWGDLPDRVEHSQQWSDEFDEALRAGDMAKAKSMMESYSRAREHGHTSDAIEIAVYAEGGTRDRHIDAIEHLLHRVFAAMNLSSPGSCTFVETSIHSSPTEDDPRPDVHRLTLQHGLFEDALSSAEHMGWPALRCLPVADTWHWLEQVLPINTVAAQSPIQRAILAILNSSTEPHLLSPSTYVWLSLALEALYASPPQQVLKSLRDRCFLVLGPPATNRKPIARALAAFYDSRSRFVHGDFPILSPSRYTTHSKEFDEQTGSLFDQSGFITAILLGTLQQLISHRWGGLLFTELFTGSPLPPLDGEA